MDANTQPKAPLTPAAAESLALLKAIRDAIEAQSAGLWAHLQSIEASLAEVKDQLSELRAAPQPPASQPPASGPAPANTRDFTAESLVMTTDERGKPAYKVKGFPYSEFGVRVWPEVLPLLGVDPASLKPGPNPLPAGLVVRAQLNDAGNPRKIISKGDGSACGQSHNGNGASPQPSARTSRTSVPPEPEAPPF